MWLDMVSQSELAVSMAGVSSRMEDSQVDGVYCPSEYWLELPVQSTRKENRESLAQAFEVLLLLLTKAMCIPASDR